MDQTGQPPHEIEVTILVHKPCGNKVLSESDGMPPGVLYCAHCRIDIHPEKPARTAWQLLEKKNYPTITVRSFTNARHRLYGSRT